MEMDFDKIATVNVTELTDEELAQHLDNIRKRVRDKKTGTVKTKKTKTTAIERLSAEDKLRLLALLGGNEDA